LINIKQVSLAADTTAFFLLFSTLIALGIQNNLILFGLSRKYIISKYRVLYDSFISFHGNMLLLPRNDPVWEFITLFKLLMMTSALQGCFRRNKFLHIFKKSI
jgi:hypothetical protein